MAKNPPANAGDSGSIPTSERSLKKELATHPGVLAREILWTEEPGGLQFLVPLLRMQRELLIFQSHQLFTCC